MKEKIKKDLMEGAYIKMKISQESLDEIELAANWILEAYQENGRLVLFGNGGSAADAQHIAGEFVNFFRIPTRPMMDCLALTTNTSVLTAIANDTGYENVFSKQVESLVNCKDVVVGLSTSGNAKNVIKGLEMAKNKGAKTILFTGQNGGRAALTADLVIRVPSNDTPRIQEAHIGIAHIICDIVEHELFKNYLDINNGLKEASAYAPARLNFGNGGDTDYYLEKLGWGCVVNTTISSCGCKCTVKRIDKCDDIKVKIENPFYHDRDEIKARREYIIEHVEDDSKKDIIAATIMEVYPEFKGEIILETNAPEMSGLGGSSSIGIALINALYKLQGKDIYDYDPQKIAYLAYKIERINMGIRGGYQDQFAMSYANGFNYMEFKKIRDKDDFAETIVIPCKVNFNFLKKIEDSLLLFYLSPRDISGNQLHAEQEKMLLQNEEAVKQILLEKRANTLDIKYALSEGDIKKLGDLLHKEYELKKQLSSKTTKDFIEELYENAISLGAYGGKISGAGGGGCMFLICNPERKDIIAEMVKGRGGIILPCELTKDNLE